jgi:hypothetical protein
VAVQPKQLAVGLLWGLAASEDLPAAFVEQVFADEVVDRPARLEGGVELDDRVRPEEAGLELLIHALADLLVANDDETARVVRIVDD